MSSPETPMLVEVAIPAPLRRTFTYAVPDALRARVEIGARVAVPFARRKVPGFVVGLGATAPEGVRVLSVAGVLDERPVFPAELASFLVEAASYYLHPIGEVLRAAAPGLDRDAVLGLKKTGFLSSSGELRAEKRVKIDRVRVLRRVEGAAAPEKLSAKAREILAILDARGRLSEPELFELVRTTRKTVGKLVEAGLLAIEKAEAPRDPFFETQVARDVPPALLPEQVHAVDAIVAAQREAAASTFLLHGVTGSGKTEVYLRAIDEARAQGRGAILLVPEIALTPQLVGRFRARFGDDIAVLHSGLTEREWMRMWQALRSGEVTLAVGARSAIFAPVAKLGLVVVDEEHDGSYKQEEGFRYQARDLAVLRAHRAGAVCVLGSATPSLESYQATETGRYKKLVLRERANARPLPPVDIVDLSRTGAGPTRDPLITLPLHRALQKCLAEGHQAVLFLNRRGFAPSVRCAQCEHVQRCPACSVTLTEHRRAGSLRCHYCDYAQPAGTACQECGSLELVTIGLGTEKLEDTLAQAFPLARIARLDRDVATGQGVEAVLDRVRRREVDVLVGTQMVTKGHDLPGVTLVGVLLADQSLAFPDFRAAERTFQLLTQVAGRAGRAETPGEVVLQTFQPKDPAILAAKHHSYDAFLRSEMSSRKDARYPPFARLAAVRVDAADRVVAERTAAMLAAVAGAMTLVKTERVDVLGPAPAPIERLRGRFRYRFLLRSAERPALRAVASAVLARIEDGIGVARASVDIDPVNML
ncbi:MAG: primosomal protein N' [Sandaracinus sp.]